MNTLPQALDEYLALRQAMGFQVRDARSLLRRFIAFLEQHETTYITHELTLDELFASVESKSGIIMSFLSKYGISDEEISLSPPLVADLYAQQWGDKEHIKFRYTANTSVTVYSEDVAAVPKAMSNVLELGKQGVAVGGQHPNQESDQFFIHQAQ